MSLDREKLLSWLRARQRGSALNTERNAMAFVAMTIERGTFDLTDTAAAGQGASVAELEGALRDLMEVVLSADETRLLMVGTNAPAMARGDERARSLHGRCDKIAEQWERSRALLKRSALAAKAGERAS